MRLAVDQLLAHIASVLRGDIGPTVAEPFAKTQAFMAAVILEKVAAQLRAAENGNPSDLEEVQSTVGAIEADAEPAPGVRAAVERLRTDTSDAAWSALVRAVYAERDGLGAERFERMLGHVRQALRTRLDRVLVYAA